MLTSNDGVKVRIYFVVVILFGLFVYVGVVLYRLQIVRHDELYDKAKKRYTAVHTKVGKRGEIRDIDGHLLVGNVPVTQIVADPSIIDPGVKEEKLAWLLNSYFGSDYRETLRNLQQKERRRKNQDGSFTTLPRQYAIMVKEAAFDDAERFKTTLRVNDIRGVSFREGYRRYYPKNMLMANVLGFIGGGGVESAREDTTKPAVTEEHYEVDRSGIKLPYGEGIREDARDGEHVYLTISEPIQSIVEEELDKVMQKWKPKTAYAVMADPRTGNIMALAQRPSFNPNDRSKMDGEAWRVRAIEDSFEPGSVMKPLVVAGALDLGIVSPRTMVDCENGLWVYQNRSMRDTHPEKMVPVSDVIKFSSNIGTAKIGLMLGKERLNTILRSFGLGTRSGIPIKPETAGQFSKLNNWDALSITRFPIGYGVGVSPVQMVRAYCALADGGNLRKLRLIDRVEDAETGEVIKIAMDDPVNIYNNAERANQIVDMMASVTQRGGTATRAAIPGYEVAGKTGTSRKWIPGNRETGQRGAYSYSKSYATFAGFVPARDPAFVLVVVVDEAVGSIYGGVVAAPAFKDIASRTLKFLDIKEDPALLPPERTTAATRPAAPSQPQAAARPAAPTAPAVSTVPAPTVRRQPAAPATPVVKPPEKREKVFIPLDENYYRRGYRQNQNKR